MQKSKYAKLLCIALSLAMLLSMIPLSVSAAEQTEQNEVFPCRGKLSMVGNHLLVSAERISNYNSMFGGGEESLTISVDNPQTTVITRVEATIKYLGPYYEEVGISCGTKRETGSVANNSIVHIDDINSSEFAFAGGTRSAEFSDVTVYYTVNSVADAVDLPEGAAWITPKNVWYKISGDTIHVGGAGELPSLALVKLPDTVTKAVVDEGIEKIGKYAFAGKENLESIVIAKSVTNMDQYAFADCSSLTEVIFANGKTAFDGKTFDDVDKSKLTIKGMCYYIDQEVKSSVETAAETNGIAFSSVCMYLNGYDVWDQGKCKVCSKYHGQNGTVHTYEDGVCTLCHALELPEGAAWATVPPYGDDMTGKVWFKVEGDTLTVGGSGAVPRNIGNLIPDYRTAIKHIVVEDGITVLQSSSFSYFNAAETISLPDTLRSIESMAIYNMESLKRVEIPASVKTIDYCFRYCTALEEIIFHEGLETISDFNIYGDFALTSVVIPASVTRFTGNLSKQSTDRESFDLIFLGRNTEIGDSSMIPYGNSIRVVKSPCGSPAQEACNDKYNPKTWESNAHTYTNGVCCCGAVCAHDPADYAVDFTWNEEGTTVTAAAKVCGECGMKLSDLDVNDVTVEEVILKEATHYAAGEKTYKASVTVDNETYTGESGKTFTVDAIPHHYVDFVCEYCKDELLDEAKAAAIEEIEAAAGDSTSITVKAAVTAAKIRIDEAGTVADVFRLRDDYVTSIEELNIPVHEHTFENDYTYDENHHWYACTCESPDCKGIVSGFAAHRFGEGEVNGNATTYTCEDCGYQKVIYGKADDDEGEVIGGVSFTGISLTLGSEISINFYMNLTEDALTNGKMVFTIGKRMVEAEVRQNSNGCCFTCPLTALEMAETVKATFTYNSMDYIQEYSVEEYTEQIVTNADQYGKEAVALAKKIANYGHYAQTYLESIHANVTIGDDGYAATDKYGDMDIDIAKAAEALAGYKVTASGISENVSLYGSTVYFDSATALNYYITAKDGAAPAATAVNTVTGQSKDVEIKLYKDNIYIVSVRDITATELADDITVTINGELTFNGSVFAYCKAVMNKDGQTEAAKNAMAAFYEYYEAAVEYAKTQG